MVPESNAADATPSPGAVPPPSPILGRVLAVATWALAALAASAWGLGVVRFIWSAAANPPPLRLIRVEGIHPWTEQELYRARTGFVGQFLVEGDGVWRVVARDPTHWEVVYWDFEGGMARRWPAGPDDSQKAILLEGGIAVGPVIAAATRVPGGDLSLVLHGHEPDGPVWLTQVKSDRLAHHPLLNIKPFDLAGFGHRDGTYEFLTVRCTRHVLEPGKPLVRVPLQGCEKKGRRVEWASLGPAGWTFAYSDPVATRTDGQNLRTLFMADRPGSPGRLLGDLAGRGFSEDKWEERVDPTPGDVLPSGQPVWHTHAIRDGRLVEIDKPPKALYREMVSARQVATQIIVLGQRASPNRRIRVFSAIKVASAGPGRGRPGKRGARGARRRSPADKGQVITRWLWMFRMPERWLAVETRGSGGQRRLSLTATDPDRSHTLNQPRLPGLLNAAPARGQGFWLFDSVGRYLRVGKDLARVRAPGFAERIGRVLRLDHLQRTAVVIRGGEPVRRSGLDGFAHRWSLPGILLGFPLLVLLWAIPWSIRRMRVGRGRRRDPAALRRVLLGLVPAALYLILSGLLFYSFWQVTAAL